MQINRAKIEQRVGTQASMRIEDLTEAFPDGLAVFDVSQRASLVNKNLAKMTGLPTEVFYLSEFIRLIPSHHALTLEKIDPVFKRGESIHLPEVEFFKFWYELFLIPLYQKGDIVGAILALRDITIAREAEIIKAKEEFLFQTVHDLRAPATAIKLAAENYSDAESLAKHPKMLKEGIELIQEANTRMLGLINSLLDSARSRAEMVKRERVVISPILQDIVKEFTPIAAQKNVKIEYIPKLDLPQVFARPQQLKEIFGNLIDNAIKYNRENGSVTITILLQEQNMIMEFRDTGYGIPKDQQEKIFQKFFRARGKEIQVVTGTGLGLSITKKLVEEMGGELLFSSVEGSGSTFAVSLPIAN